MSFKHLKESHIEDHGVGKSEWKAYWECGILLRRFTLGADAFYARTWFSADDGHIFTSVQIVGGRRAAAEYRVEIDLSSAEADTGLTFRGPVLPIDAIPDDGECFKVDAETFKIYRLVQ